MKTTSDGRPAGQCSGSLAAEAALPVFETDREGNAVMQAEWYRSAKGNSYCRVGKEGLPITVFRHAGRWCFVLGFQDGAKYSARSWLDEGEAQQAALRAALKAERATERAAMGR
jgi:hypothetical protein